MEDLSIIDNHCQLTSIDIFHLMFIAFFSCSSHVHLMFISCSSHVFSSLPKPTARLQAGDFFSPGGSTGFPERAEPGAVFRQRGHACH